MNYNFVELLSEWLYKTCPLPHLSYLNNDLKKLDEEFNLSGVNVIDNSKEFSDGRLGCLDFAKTMHPEHEDVCQK